ERQRDEQADERSFHLRTPQKLGREKNLFPNVGAKQYNSKRGLRATVFAAPASKKVLRTAPLVVPHHKSAEQSFRRVKKRCVNCSSLHLSLPLSAGSRQRKMVLRPRTRKRFRTWATRLRGRTPSAGSTLASSTKRVSPSRARTSNSIP